MRAKELQLQEQLPCPQRHNIYVRFVFTFYLIFVFYKANVFRPVSNVLDFFVWLLPNWHGLEFLREEGEHILSSEYSCRFLSFETIYELYNVCHLQTLQVGLVHHENFSLLFMKRCFCPSKYPIFRDIRMLGMSPQISLNVLKTTRYIQSSVVIWRASNKVTGYFRYCWYRPLIV